MKLTVAIQALPSASMSARCSKLMLTAAIKEFISAQTPLNERLRCSHNTVLLAALDWSRYVYHDRQGHRCAPGLRCAGLHLALLVRLRRRDR
eukprot:6182333-Pleurochrysis_carterae.AAC.1